MSFKAIPLRARSGYIRLWTLVDAEDYEWISRSRWSVRSGWPHFYAGNGQDKLHRIILGLVPGDGMYADHINGDTLDNRRENLRVVDPKGNSANQERDRAKVIADARWPDAVQEAEYAESARRIERQRELGKAAA